VFEKNLKIFFIILLIPLFFLYGQDGPYIFYNDSPDSIITISVSLNGDISTDTLSVPESVNVQLPSQEDFFNVKLASQSFEEEKCIFPPQEKLFAVADIEGNYKDFVKILTNNGIIDENLNWSFGKGHLVLNGDFVDRGEFVTQELWLIFKLEKEAERSGGKVHYILGNHDIMILRGDDRYAVEKYHELAERTGKKIKDYFGQDTFFGRSMRTKNVIEKIGGTIFVHGGISDSLLMQKLSLSEINRIARSNIDFPDSLIDKQADLIYGRYGPVWYRGLVTDYKYYDKIAEVNLDRILSFYDADRIVVGHCVVDDISTDFEGKVVRIDVDHYENESCGIFIKGDRIYKALKSGKREKL
jgi:hypothetical protein